MQPTPEALTPFHLVRTVVSDGVMLDGAYFAPEAHSASGSLDPSKTPPSAFPVDACLLVHGTGGNFYAPGLLETFAQQAALLGLAVLRANTRGHDGMASIPNAHRRGEPGGAAFEKIEQCLVDLQGWLDWMAQRGCRRVCLVGHSMGAVKSLYTASHGGHPLLQCIAAICPPRFHHAGFLAHPQGKAFRDDFQSAQALVELGQGDVLRRFSQPLPLVMTAAGFVEKYSPDDPFDYLPWLPSLSAPTLLMLGRRASSTSLAFIGAPDSVRQLDLPSDRLTLVEPDEADVNFTGMQHRPFEIAQTWWSTLPAKA